MLIFIYGFSPITIQMRKYDNLIVITIKKQEQLFRKIGIAKDKIIILEKLSMKKCFSALQKIECEYEIEQIFTLDESIMDWCGALNDYFTKTNSQTLQGLLFKDKYFMRVFLQGVVNQPAFYEYSDIDKMNETFLAKPRKESSAKGIKKCNSLNEIRLIENKEDYVYESLVEYDAMFTVDGYAVDGEIKRFFSHEYENKILDSFENIGKEKHILVSTNSYYWKNMDVIKKLFEVSEKVVKKYSRNKITPFHFEWFYNMRDNIFTFCEVGSRFGGGKIPQLINDAFNCNILDEFWNLQFENLDSVVLNNSNKKIVMPSRIAASFLALEVDGKIEKNATPCMSNVKEYRQFKTSGNICENASTTDELIYICRFVSENWAEYRHSVEQLCEFSRTLLKKEEILSPANKCQ